MDILPLRLVFKKNEVGSLNLLQIDDESSDSGIIIKNNLNNARFEKNRNADVEETKPDLDNTIEYQKITVATLDGIPEIKVVMEEKCVGYRIPTPWGDIKDQKCADVPQTYKRDCNKTIYVEIAYPASIRKDVEECLKGSAVAGAISAVIASPEAGASVFAAALKACLAAKGTKWIEKIAVSAGEESICQDWHPI